MRASIFFTLLLTGFSCRAQDLDYPDYRNKRDNFSKVSQKDIRADLASFTLAGIDESISKLPLPKIPIASYGRNYMIFEGDGIKVTVYTALFDPGKHKLQFMEKNLVKIDGKGYYGNYGKTPRSSISAVIVQMDKDSISLPPIAFSDIHDLEFGYADASGVLRSTNAVYFSADRRRMYIYLLNKSDTGSYEVTWIIQDKQYLRRVLDYNLLKF